MLKPVFDKLGLDAEGLQQRLHFLDWTAADGDRLRRVGPFGRRLSNDFVDALYQRLGQYPETRAILRGDGLVERLKRSQQGYYDRLFSGTLDQSYLEERVRIGHIHEQVGVELKWYLGPIGSTSASY
ncbi:protoglobin domain-containing protein [Halopseudomonas pachastrellae]|nr:protoglobin domain-containing protein [Halopseudomonas pachastrellae]